MSRLLLLHIFLCGSEVSQVLVRLRNMIHGQVGALDIKPDSFKKFDNLLSLLCLKSVIISRWNVDGEFFKTLRISDLG